MMKTGQQIVDDIFQLLKCSALASGISGCIYFYGTRPKNSKAEDAIIRFVTGIPDQIQTGVVNINIYVPDLGPGDDGYEQDITRCTELEAAAAGWVKSLTSEKSDYKFRLAQTIYTEASPDINQHFVSVRLNFKLLTL